MKYFKVKLKMKRCSLETFVLIRARSIGEAVVLADSRSCGNHLELCDNPAIEITSQEYYNMIKSL